MKARHVIIRAIGRVSRCQTMTFEQRRDGREKLERVLLYLREQMGRDRANTVYKARART